MIRGILLTSFKPLPFKDLREAAVSVVNEKPLSYTQEDKRRPFLHAYQYFFFNLINQKRTYPYFSRISCG